MTTPSRRHATAVRPSWEELPQQLRDGLVGQVGAIAAAATQTGGFTPGLAVRLELANGQRVFAKGIGSYHVLAGKYRVEALTARQLPDTTPAPRLRWDGEIAGWVVLVFDDIEGRHADLSPGSPDIGPVVTTVGRLAELLTPCPVPAALPATVELADLVHGWGELTAEPPTTWITGRAATWMTSRPWRPSGCPRPKARPCYTATSTSRTC